MLLGFFIGFGKCHHEGMEVSISQDYVLVSSQFTQVLNNAGCYKINDVCKMISQFQ